MKETQIVDMPEPTSMAARQYRREILSYLENYPKQLQKAKKQGGFQQVVIGIANRAGDNFNRMAAEDLSEAQCHPKEDFMEQVRTINMGRMQVDEIVSSQMWEEVNAMFNIPTEM